MNILWKDIIINGKNTGWKVSNYGTVKRLDGTITEGYENPYGYLRVKINYKTCYIHRLVAQAFLSNPENKPEVDHINAIRNDNRLENLRWCTKKENMNNPNFIKKMKEKGSPMAGKNHNLETKNKMSEIKKINHPKMKKIQCIETGEIFNSCKAAEEKYNLKNFLYKVIDKPNLTAGGFHWINYKEV